MNRALTLSLSLAIIAVALIAGAAPLAAAGALPLGAALIGDTAQVGGAAGTMLPWRRVRRDIPAFENVVAAGRASTEIPRYAYTLYGCWLRLGGTAFVETNITEVRLKLGPKTIWFGTGADIRAMSAYKGYYDGNRQFVYLDFTQKSSKSIGGEFVGGIDMQSLPAGKLMLEILTSGATAPTLTAKGNWGPPQANDVLQKLLQYSWSTSATGRRSVPLSFAGARLRRLFALYTGTDWVTTGTAAAWSGNTGNGAMGAITVSAAAQVGVHKFFCTQANANLGTFQHQLPSGVIQSTRMIVASAYSGGGLAFTLADGATDYIPGDGFDITVSENTDGNLSRFEVIKNGEPVWDLQCTEARQAQKQYGFAPQTKMYVVDFELDKWPDGALPTADARTLEFYVTLTASDTLTLYAEVLDTPGNN